MARTVFILGAGASREAGGPLMCDFLDRAEDLLAQNRIKDQSDRDAFELVFHAMAELQPIYAKASVQPNNIESVFAAFEMAHLLGRLGKLGARDLPKLGTAMRCLIVRTLQNEIKLPVRETTENPVVCPPPPYDRFAELLADMNEDRTKTKPSVISFNYDLALEFACYEARMGVDYGVDENRSSSCLPLYKLHGSMNWAEHKKSRHIIPWYMEKYFSEYSLPNLRFGSRDRPQMVMLSMAQQLREFTPEGFQEPCKPEPIIVPPTWAKTQYYKRLQNIWKSAAAHLADADTIIVVGYSLPPTDEFFRYLYALGTVSDRRLRNFWVFDPDPNGAVEQRFKDLLGPLATDRFLLRRQTFSQAIDIIRSDLNVKSR